MNLFPYRDSFPKSFLFPASISLIGEYLTLETVVLGLNDFIIGILVFFSEDYSKYLLASL